MKTIYTGLIALYSAIAGAASPFSVKARRWVRGRRGWRERLSSFSRGEGKVAWVHCASLGEFEQGRPVIEKIRRDHPDWKVVVTFFSPSGYEIRKDYRGADMVMYLPTDLPANVRFFLDHIKPDLALFVKYEFWYNYLSELKRRNIPTYLVSGIFRPDQYFFRWYGSFARGVFQVFNRIFLQDEQSGRLLESIGYHRYSVTGDTRFDRVSQIAAAAKDLPVIEKFRGKESLFVAGSSWDEDEEIIVRYINSNSGAMKWVIAPHEIDEAHLCRIEKRLTPESVRYSRYVEGAKSCRVMIIDNIGMLSSVYRYASIAAVGGGFGRGIHNILEPACWGIPVLFGPHHLKFREAVQLKERGGAVSFDNFETFTSVVEKYLSDPVALEAAGNASAIYISENKGSTDKVYKEIFENQNAENLFKKR
ncbi:MAG: 3-deoxy-D-manno-octulosonic acid transferase [Bacteroidales bacterium]|jgi:3-deoxy-D-manno-octulosonic-acid transferase|nr:3-deoxy-D-manno-octulosonic acid transferase [Bacteroidales bacterium]MDX9926758.1 glycosyltransferase N-terminal domain-containing protein [Bacteroidales bacterium]HOC48121.1 glycosyltransferase N-terminal domain-containing protein [Bacteroidales bacterium]HPS98058.1 glycosyltransferase N-terminal domain-containing protein [Bacteroidales bacterium]